MVSEMAFWNERLHELLQFNLLCCNFWEKCINSPKIGQGCSTPLMPHFVYSVLWMISENEEEELFILFWKVGPPVITNLLWNVSYTFKFATSQTSKNFQNKNEFEKSPKKEEGGR